MNIRSCLVTVLILLLAVPALSNPENAGNVPQQLIINIPSDESPDSVLMDAGVSAQILDSLNGQRMFLLQLPSQVPIEAIIATLDSSSAVAFVHANHIVNLPQANQVSVSFPDENRPPLLSGVTPESYFDQSAVYDVGIDSASLLADGTGEIVAVVDNGIEIDHPLFENRLVSGWDFFDEDADPSEEQGTLLSHGTFVSGLVALTAPGAKIMPLRAFDAEGTGNIFAVAESIDHAIVNGATVINLSFNMYTNPSTLQEVIARAQAQGIVVVASAGNDSTDVISYPAAYDDVIAVSSVDTLDVPADFTNYGSSIDVCAPGVLVYSAFAGEYEWGWWSGTSFSAAIVSGVCALVRDYTDGQMEMTMEEHIRLSAQRDLLPGWVVPHDEFYGWGMVNAWDAVFAFDHGDWDLLDGVNSVDLSVMIDYLFGGVQVEHIDRTDTSCDGFVDQVDLSRMTDYLYFGKAIDVCYPPLY